MAFCAFVGDEVSAAGFRLGGAQVYVPESNQVSDLFTRLQKQVRLILITADKAQYIPASALSEALRRAEPLVLIISDVRDQKKAPDMAGALRRQLGMTE